VQKRKFWGWGIEGGGPSQEDIDQSISSVEKRLGTSLPRTAEPPKENELNLPSIRIKVPATLSAICRNSPWERAAHHYGASYRDVVRAFRREFPKPPDWVAYPQSEGDVSSILDWCGDNKVAAIPFGGGSSVVGGVEMPSLESGNYEGAISIDLSNLRKVMEIDKTSRAARIQAGILGPDLENQLRPHGLTLRHFPQSFEFSSLGGWIATRSGGHFATVYTHIEDLVESIRAVTPSGILESRRLPGSGAGPSPDRMLAGSEGILGIITEAWMRLQDRPKFRASAAVLFPEPNGFLKGAEAVREVSQSMLFPTNCRILDKTEAFNNGVGNGDSAVLILGFESADHPTDKILERGIEICRDAGGTILDNQINAQSGESSSVNRDGAAGAWRKAFIEMPYIRDALVGHSVVVDTFETCITWDQFPSFHANVTATVEKALREICGSGSVSCRFTHVYPDGPAPYYSITAPGIFGSELEQWDEIKAAAADIVISEGGTITHHHAVGRDHRPWYDQQRPDIFADALRAAKQQIDPGAILNPGVLLDP